MWSDLPIPEGPLKMMKLLLVFICLGKMRGVDQRCSFKLDATVVGQSILGTAIGVLGFGGRKPGGGLDLRKMTVADLLPPCTGRLIAAPNKLGFFCKNENISSRLALRQRLR